MMLLGALASSVLLCASLIALGVLQVRRCCAQRAGAKSDPSASVSPVQRSANSDATESLWQRVMHRVPSVPQAHCRAKRRLNLLR